MIFHSSDMFGMQWLCPLCQSGPLQKSRLVRRRNVCRFYFRTSPSLFFFFFFLFLVLEIEPRVSGMGGKHSSTELESPVCLRTFKTFILRNSSNIHYIPSITPACGARIASYLWFLFLNFGVLQCQFTRSYPYFCWEVAIQISLWSFLCLRKKIFFHWRVGKKRTFQSFFCFC